MEASDVDNSAFLKDNLDICGEWTEVVTIGLPLDTYWQKTIKPELHPVPRIPEALKKVSS